MRQSWTGSFLGLVFCSSILAALAAGAFGALCMALYWILSGGDTEGNPFGPMGFALAGAVVGALMALARSLDRLDDWPEILCDPDTFPQKECAKRVQVEAADNSSPLAATRNGKVFIARHP